MHHATFREASSPLAFSTVHAFHYVKSVFKASITELSIRFDIAAEDFSDHQAFHIANKKGRKSTRYFKKLEFDSKITDRLNIIIPNYFITLEQIDF